MDPAERMRQASMQSEKRFQEQAARDREIIKKDTERNMEFAKHQQELAQQNMKQSSGPTSQNKEEYWNEQSTITKIFMYIILFIILCFILWVLYNILLNGFQYGFFG